MENVCTYFLGKFVKLKSKMAKPGTQLVFWLNFRQKSTHTGSKFTAPGKFNVRIARVLGQLESGLHAARTAFFSPLP